MPPPLHPFSLETPASRDLRLAPRYTSIEVEERSPLGVCVTQLNVMNAAIRLMFGRLSKGPGGANKLEAKIGGTVPVTLILVFDFQRRCQGAFDWVRLAQKIMIPLSLIDFWQISPHGSKEFRHLSTWVHGGKKKDQANSLQAVKANIVQPSRWLDSDSHIITTSNPTDGTDKISKVYS
ncbi:uncharacterized protein LY79DRAFT_585051 [Colletotrichum navitas]|uniref:Uncharacterized protein n=1 Tax=Colletotrichum navitas TaxID=681940 RepID=A0AAD8PKK8_9PEZI|nr:uncharacterized protein LY79DRAFT_585051 [Colletotrichum navitas]KAK1566036.1 hypothetical protein LY79DRAFT_585051 [Colletotrichum navitas]